MVGKQ